MEFKRIFPAKDMAFGVPAGPSNMRQTRRESLAWYGVGDGGLRAAVQKPTTVAAG
jgi:hypothetical protein